MQLRTTFSARAELATYLRAQFPAAAARSAAISPTRGGNHQVEALLEQIDVAAYRTTRNMLSGAVTHLSPYLRHGVVTLAEVRRHILAHTTAQKAYKLLQELAWRDYYQRVYARLGEAIWQDIEPYKTGVTNYSATLPEDIAQGTSGVTCVDAFAQDLQATGYLHNHARLWTAAYVVHHRRVRWQAGAHWFLQHLLDGDPASNNLSWQWVASTFAAQPYFFNQENLARYTENTYCRQCPLLHNGCPFEGTYEEVAARIFPSNVAQKEDEATEASGLTKLLVRDTVTHPLEEVQVREEPARWLVWLNEESLNPFGPALEAHPAATPVFVFDEAAIEAAGWTLKRLAFIYECLLDIPRIQLYRGSPLEVLLTLTEGGQGIATTSVVEPRLQQQIREIMQHRVLRSYPVEPFVDVHDIRDLRRFSRYWRQVEKTVVWDS